MIWTDRAQEESDDETRHEGTEKVAIGRVYLITRLKLTIMSFI